MYSRNNTEWPNNSRDKKYQPVLPKLPNDLTQTFIYHLKESMF